MMKKYLVDQPFPPLAIIQSTLRDDFHKRVTDLNLSTVFDLRNREAAYESRRDLWQLLPLNPQCDR